MPQLDMRHLLLPAFAAQNRTIRAPVKREGVARVKLQWRKGPTPRGLLLTLPVGPAPSRKRCHPDPLPEAHSLPSCTSFPDPVSSDLPIALAIPVNATLCTRSRSGGRVVEGARLESV
jgi:hypothetical protein